MLESSTSQCETVPGSLSKLRVGARLQRRIANLVVFTNAAVGGVNWTVWQFNVEKRSVEMTY